MKKFIIYGVGNKGKLIYDYLKQLGYSDCVYAFCDKNAGTIGTYADKSVYTFSELSEMDLPYLNTVSNTKDVNEMLKENKKKIIGSTVSELATYLGTDRVAFNREFCAFYHINEMDDYFEVAENALDTFWSEDSPFYQMFKELDLDNVIELACGRGRHVPKYIDQANHITLVDILDKNIDYCQQRFSNYSKISYYRNDGYDLKELETAKYSALFAYDAMVHFELIDIYSYMNDIYRVLVNGGYALIHHSNMTSDYKMSFEKAGNPGGRNYMSKELFAYIAYRAGFDIIEQKIIDWSLPNMDCISLVRKPL